MSRHGDHINLTLEILKKSAELKNEQILSLKRHQLAESEFEVLVAKEGVDSARIEADRAKLVSLYEQYVDACLALRSYTIEAEKRLDSIIKEHKQS